MNYCKGLLFSGERKSIEPMAARLDSQNVQPVRQFPAPSAQSSGQNGQTPLDH
jgi:hypothetical protein